MRPRQTDFDAVVIGAGHNGLITAAYLARHGVSTLLVEARHIVGGTAASESFADTVANICNCDHLTFRTTPVSEELNLASHGLEYIDVEPSQINGDWTTQRFWPMYHEVDRTLDALNRVHPASVAGYRKYARAMVPLARLVLAAAAEPPSRRGLLATVAKRGGRGVPALLRYSRMSAADVLREFFDDDAVIGPALVEGPVVWGVSPETPGTGLGAMSYALRHASKVGRPRGGSGKVPEAILSSYLVHGGILRLNTRVVAINCENERVNSVQMSDNTTVTTRVVVSACNPHDTFVRWLRNPPPGASKMIARWRDAAHQDGYESKIDAVISDLPRLSGLDTDLVRELGGDDIAPTTVISPSPSELHRGAQLLANGQTMPRMAMLVNVPSTIDDSLAPRGQHVFSLEALYTPYALSGGWSGSNEPQRWLDQFAGLVQPGFLSSIEKWRVVTPVDYETDFHLPRGHATSFAGGPIAAFLGRPKELTRYRTNVKGLYLTGAATFPGAGVWGSSGRNAALTVIRDSF